MKTSHNRKQKQYQITIFIFNCLTQIQKKNCYLISFLLSDAERFHQMVIYLLLSKPTNSIVQQNCSQMKAQIRWYIELLSILRRKTAIGPFLWASWVCFSYRPWSTKSQWKKASMLQYHVMFQIDYRYLISLNTLRS